ncbi:MAG: Gfo/Idh/MocA family oxidoreductase [bacterium]
MSDRLGWGIIGTGRRAREVMIPALFSSAGSEIVGVCSREPEGVRDSLSDWPEFRVYDGPEKLVEDDSIQVAYISSPNFMHVPHAVQCIDAGKHIFMEAPMALSVDGAHKVQEKARAAGVQVGLAFQSRFHPALEKLKEEVREGAIGEVLCLEAGFLDREDLPPGWWQDSARAGPAALMRYTTHAIDLLCWIKNKSVVEVGGMGTDIGHPSINRMASVMLRFEDETQGMAVGGCGMGELQHYVRAEGDRGRIEVQGDFNGDNLTVFRKTTEGDTEEIRFEPDDPVGKMVAAFTRALREEGDYQPAGTEGKEIAVITCSAIDAMKSRRVVKSGEVLRVT